MSETKTDPPPTPVFRRAIRFMGIVTLFAAAAGAAYFAGVVVADGVTPKPAARTTANGLSVYPAALDLGEVWEHPQHVIHLRITNDTAAPKVIERFTGSCGCTTITPQGVTLPPHGSADLTVSIDLTQKQPHQLRLAQRALSVEVAPVFAGDFGASPGWTLTGTIRSYVSLEATQLGFLDGCVHRGPTRSRKLLVSAHVPLARIEAEADPASAVIQVEPAGPTGTR